MGLSYQAVEDSNATLAVVCQGCVIVCRRICIVATVERSDTPDLAQPMRSMIRDQSAVGIGRMPVVSDRLDLKCRTQQKSVVVSIEVKTQCGITITCFRGSDAGLGRVEDGRKIRDARWPRSERLSRDPSVYTMSTSPRYLTRADGGSGHAEDESRLQLLGRMALPANRRSLGSHGSRVNLRVEGYLLGRSMIPHGARFILAKRPDSLAEFDTL